MEEKELQAKIESTIKLLKDKGRDIHTYHLTTFSHDSQKARASIAMLSLSQSDRFITAFKKSSLFFALAIGSVFLPVLHFVLVPTFLIVTVIVFMKGMKQTSWVVTGYTQCPQCKKWVEISPQYYTEPLRTSCSQCGERLLLKKQ